MSTQMVADRVKKLTSDKVLIRMANDGQILTVRCEMPHCYCPKGPNYFAQKGGAQSDWILTLDHHPRLESDGGTREAGNARLGHRLCNNRDYGMRTKIRAKLNKGKSLDDIAAHLEGRVPPPNKWDKWTAPRVRKVWVS